MVLILKLKGNYHSFVRFYDNFRLVFAIRAWKEIKEFISDVWIIGLSERVIKISLERIITGRLSVKIQLI